MDFFMQILCDTCGVNSFWKDRPTLVTGATGLVGGWLVKRLLDAGADVVCLIRDWVPHSELVRAGLVSRVKTVRGNVVDQALLERVLGEYEIDTLMHLAAQTIVPVANRNPVGTFERSRYPRHLEERCSQASSRGGVRQWRRSWGRRRTRRMAIRKNCRTTKIRRSRDGLLTT